MSANLKGLVREKLGSRWARRLRAQGRIPCCIQGEEKDNVDLSIDADAFAYARRHHEHLFDIALDQGDEETAMIRELQWDLIGDNIVHVEFRRVIRGQKVEVEVSLEFTGHPKGGVLNHLINQITILCLPSEIPDSIEAKVGEMEPGHTLHARDLILPENTEMMTDGEAQIAVVNIVRAIEDEPVEGEEVEGEVADATGDEAATDEEAKPEGE